MGQAKRNREKLTSMSGGDIVRMCAMRLFERHMLPTGHRGACYFLTFLLHHHLAKKHKVETQVMVGFVNDGTDNIWGSHAWLVYENKITDLAVHLPLYPEASPLGPALIMGTMVRKGEAEYRYAPQAPADAMTDEQLLSHAQGESQRVDMMRTLSRKRQEHEMMQQLASSSLDNIYAYLDAAPGPPYSYYEKIMG